MYAINIPQVPQYTYIPVNLNEVHTHWALYCKYIIIFMITNLALLHTLSDHHYTCGPLLPNHPPEIISSALFRSRRSYILIRLVVTLCETSAL